jgi:4-carboxymuconolactone decarboxylase
MSHDDRPTQPVPPARPRPTPRIAPARPGPFTRLLLRVARRKTRELAGRETEGMIGPLEAYAHLPELLFAYCMLEGATARLDRVPERLRVLAELKAATLTTCEYCIDIGSQIARRAGVSDEELLALPRYRDSDLFDEDEKLVLDYAVAVSRTPVVVPDELFGRLRARFDEAMLVELTNLLALENMRGRFNMALGFHSSGFTEGMVCALPESGELPEGGEPPHSEETPPPPTTTPASAATRPATVAGA